MSGHSHFKSIKHAKGLADKRRGQVFSKLAREIEITAREGGDPDFNSKLRLAIERAKELNMPTNNIERAIKRGTGELAGEKLEEVLFEAYGPGNIAIIIEGITDNKNRTKNEITQTLNQHNGKLADPGSVKWMFDRKGAITLLLALEQKKEELELKAIEAGAEDLYWHTITDEAGGAEKKFLDVYTKIEDLEKVKKELEDKKLEIESASLDWVAKQQLEIEEKDKITCQKLFESLDENEAVQEIYSNIKLP